MKLKPRQMVGLVVIVVFGGGMIFRLTQPSEREIMERRLASLPRVTAPDMDFPTLDLPSTTTTLPPNPTLDAASSATAALSIPGEPDYLTLGSQEAKDDLYCSAVLGQEFDVKIKTDHPDKVTPLLDAQNRLDSAGIAKLKAEGATDGANWAAFTLRYDDKAKHDYQANALRIPVAACVERASKLPPGNLY